MGFPVSYKHNPHTLEARKEKESAAQLTPLSKRVDELSAVHAFMNTGSLTKDDEDGERSLKRARQ